MKNKLNSTENLVQKPSEYDTEVINVLKFTVENIRKRPAMYVGDCSIRGLKHLLQYYFDDFPKKEFQTTQVDIEIRQDNWINIRITEIDTTVMMNTITHLEKGKFDKCTYGLPLMIGLSDEINITIQKFPSVVVLNANNGIHESWISTAQTKENMIELSFKLDLDIFKNVEYDYEIINHFLRQYAILNPHFNIKSSDKVSNNQQVNIFYYPKGIAHLLTHKIAEQHYGNPIFRLDLNTSIEHYDYQISFAYQDFWLGQTFVTSFANNDELLFGGSLIDGIFDGIILAVKRKAKKDGTKIKINHKIVQKQLILIASVKGQNFNFGGSIKENLVMPEMRKQIKNYISKTIDDYFSNNQTIADKVLDIF